MTTTDTHVAPLAQLAAVDNDTWRQLYASQADNHPGTNPACQALAAALLGHPEVSRQILADGAIYRTWPEMRPTPPRDVDIRTSLSAGILALNTLLHPDATSDDDFSWLEGNAEEILSALVTLRDALPAPSEVPA